MEKDAGQLFHELKEDITAFVEIKFEYFKLSAYERVGKVTGLLSYGLILMFLAFFALLFIFFSVGFLLGDLFNSIGLGFSCVAGLYILIMLIVVLCKKQIQLKIINVVIEALTNNDDNDGNNNKEQETNTTGEVIRR